MSIGTVLSGAWRYLSSPTTKSFAAGIGLGGSLTQVKYNEDTIKQGGNYLLAIPMVQAQIAFVFNDLGKVLGEAMKNMSAAKRTGVSWSVSLLGLSVGLFAFVTGAVKHSEKSNGRAISDIPSNFIKKRLSEQNYARLSRVSHYVAEHTGSVMQISEIALCAFKYYQGSTIEPVATLTMMALGVLDRGGYLPQKVSIVMNKYMPVISAIALIVASNPLFIKLVAVGLVINELAPSVFNIVKYRLDDWSTKKHKEMGVDYPSLRELETPNPDFKPGQKLTKQQIDDFLNETGEFTPGSFRIVVDPKHVARSPRLEYRTQGLKYHDFLTFFEKDKWKEESLFNVLEKKYLDDDRFIKYLREILQSTGKNKELLERILDKDVKAEKKVLFLGIKEETHVNVIPFQRKADASPQDVDAWKELVIGYAEDQLTIFADNLSGKRRPKGDMGAFQLTKKHALQIVAYLKMIEEEMKSASGGKRKILLRNKQDIIMNLIVEGGGYCVQGMDRAVRICMDIVLSDNDPTKTTMMNRVLYALQQNRKQIIQTWYSMFDSYVKMGLEQYKDMFAKVLTQENNPLEGVDLGLGMDVHMFNDFLRQVTPGTGIEDESAANDKTTGYDPVGQSLAAMFLPYYRVAFWSTRSAHVPYEDWEFSKGLLEKIRTLVKDLYSEKACIELYEQFFGMCSNTIKTWYAADNTLVEKITKSAKEIFKIITWNNLKKSLKATYIGLKYSFHFTHTATLLMMEAVSNFARFDTDRVVDLMTDSYGPIYTPEEYTQWWQKYINTNPNLITDEVRAHARIAAEKKLEEMESFPLEEEDVNLFVTEKGLQKEDIADKMYGELSAEDKEWWIQRKSSDESIRKEFIDLLSDPQNGAVTAVPRMDWALSAAEIEKILTEATDYYTKDKANVSLTEEDRELLIAESTEEIPPDATYGMLSDKLRKLLIEKMAENNKTLILSAFRNELSERQQTISNIIEEEWRAKSFSWEPIVAISDMDIDFLGNMAVLEAQNKQPGEFTRKEQKEIKAKKINDLLNLAESRDDKNLTFDMLSAEDQLYLIRNKGKENKVSEEDIALLEAKAIADEKMQLRRPLSEEEMAALKKDLRADLAVRTFENDVKELTYTQLNPEEVGYLKQQLNSHERITSLPRLQSEGRWEKARVFDYKLNRKFLEIMLIEEGICKITTEQRDSVVFRGGKFSEDSQAYFKDTIDELKNAYKPQGEAPPEASEQPN